MFALVMVWFTVSPCDTLKDGFYLHVLYQSFNVKPSNFVKKKKKKNATQKKKNKEKKKVKWNYLSYWGFFPSIIQQLIIVNWVL